MCMWSGLYFAVPSLSLAVVRFFMLDILKSSALKMPLVERNPPQNCLSNLSHVPRIRTEFVVTYPHTVPLLRVMERNTSFGNQPQMMSGSLFCKYFRKLFPPVMIVHFNFGVRWCFLHGLASITFAR